MRGKSVMLLAGLASLAQANELNLYSVNTGSYVYHLTNNHGIANLYPDRPAGDRR